ncbi:hypothetical protein AB205_0179460 [Aquarana catesbeiana]|uniref:Uncharacterized protein n=1 Tax=Aquarana catesbeiana TaxID=8400 RepID=A0A2G9QKZ0_AQUCT|nr:hypothetical protein AB205_0179460 [Aquarana catesbeiana]
MTAPRKGFDYDGLGLLYWRLSRDPNFGSDREWRLEEIIEHRERRLNVSEGHWAQEDLEFLALQEWELEIAYRQLLDSAQQQGGAPFAWDYQEISVDNSEILVEESAVENLEIAIPKAETPVAETGDLIDFSAEKEQPDEPPAEELVSGPNFSVLCPAPTAVSVELQGTSPAEALVTGQRVQDLCPTPVAVPGAHGEKVAITSQQPDEGTEKEAASSPPQWQLHSLGGEIFSLLPQRLAEAYDVESPAEVLATGQTKLCPAMATTVDFQGAGAVGSSLQPQIT